MTIDIFGEPDTTPETDDTGWPVSDDPELDGLCSAYREIETQKKLHESRVKELDKELKDQALIIQAHMDGAKKVKSSAGYMLQWKPWKRKGYTVAASEGERWELRSPY